MADDDETQFDPLGDIASLIAAPVAATIRSVEQLRHGVDEFLRGVENFNATMENLNETAARVNRLLNELEEPARVLLPQLSRTVRTADEITQKVADLPIDPAEFMRAMMDLSARLGPLAQMAESASGMLGLRLPGFGRPPAPPAEEPSSTPADDAPPTPSSKSAAKPAGEKSTARKSTAKKAPSKKTAAKKSTAKGSAARKR